MNFLNCCSCELTYTDKLTIAVIASIAVGMFVTVFIILMRASRELQKEEENLLTR
jgi:energy-converting hydrogenase Eha subunit E